LHHTTQLCVVKNKYGAQIFKKSLQHSKQKDQEIYNNNLNPNTVQSSEQYCDCDWQISSENKQGGCSQNLAYMTT